MRASGHERSYRKTAGRRAGPYGYALAKLSWLGRSAPIRVLIDARSCQEEEAPERERICLIIVRGERGQSTSYRTVVEIALAMKGRRNSVWRPLRYQKPSANGLLSFSVRVGSIAAAAGTTGAEI